MKKGEKIRGVDLKFLEPKYNKRPSNLSTFSGDFDLHSETKTKKQGLFSQITN